MQCMPTVGVVCYMRALPGAVLGCRGAPPGHRRGAQGPPESEDAVERGNGHDRAGRAAAEAR
ncbi:hypothetical protein U9M48_029551 [Paspalum notatum var. saurae]|uniref:Uncharacterized protein n=1 Tax=Paspalum notatum var. saurae TaxID=547442 RepID=A0AAQ3TZ31_PASNO